MASNKRPGRRLRALARPAAGARALAVGALALLAGALALAPAGAAATRGCAAFDGQAGAQAYYLHLGGSPAHVIGRLDPDRDGVACEDLDRPYAGFANLGYNRRKNFFYGSATMPEIAPAKEGRAATHPCMLGNRHFDDGPRRLNVYRVVPGPGPDKRIFPRNGIGAESREETGKLVWKAEHEVLLPGRYYAEFEERIRLTPYGENECPAFRSRAVALP